MLKIKDDVDLNDLEQYGFKYCDETGQWEIERSNDFETLRVNVWNRKIVAYNIDRLVDVLYDLIKDGLVEKL